MLAVFKQHANRQARVKHLVAKGFSRMYVTHEMVRIEDSLELNGLLNLKRKSENKKIKIENPSFTVIVNRPLSTNNESIKQQTTINFCAR